MGTADGWRDEVEVEKNNLRWKKKMCSGSDEMSGMQNKTQNWEF